MHQKGPVALLWDIRKRRVSHSCIAGPRASAKKKAEPGLKVLAPGTLIRYNIQKRPIAELGEKWALGSETGPVVKGGREGRAEEQSDGNTKPGVSE